MINKIADPQGKKIKEVSFKKIFTKEELIYLPRKDKSWWNPERVFWKDYSDVFDTLRGYIQQDRSEIYENTFYDFFMSLGIIDKPGMNEFINVLDELKIKNDLNLYKKISPQVYKKIADSVEEDNNTNHLAKPEKHDKFYRNYLNGVYFNARCIRAKYTS